MAVIFDFPSFPVDPLFSIIVGTSLAYRPGVPSIGTTGPVSGDQYRELLSTPPTPALNENRSFVVVKRIIFNSFPVTNWVISTGGFGGAPGPEKAFVFSLGGSAVPFLVDFRIQAGTASATVAFPVPIAVGLNPDITFVLVYDASTKVFTCTAMRSSDLETLGIASTGALDSTPDWLAVDYGLTHLGSSLTMDYDVMSIRIYDTLNTPHGTLFQTDGINL